MNKQLKQFIYWLEDGDRQNWEIERYFEDAITEQKEEIKKMIVEEMLICHKENQPTSRLTSLSNKLGKL